jgi:hypothetical protein
MGSEYISKRNPLNSRSKSKKIFSLPLVAGDLLEDGVSLVIGWRFLKRLPLLPIMAKDDQCYLFTLDEI